MTRRVCAPFPFFHVLGSVCALASLAIVPRWSVVIPDAVYNATAVLRSIDKEQCNFFFSVPTMLFDLLNHKDFHTTDWSAMRRNGGGFVGAAPVPEKLFYDWCERTGMTLGQVKYMEGVFGVGRGVT